MNSKTKDAIIKLNNNFYSSVSSSFDRNRQNRNWVGVKYMLEKLPKLENPVVVDIGCGNCRLATLLKETFKGSFTYYGVDNNDYFLSKCGELCIEFQINSNTFSVDLFQDLNWDIPKGDLLLVLGLTHHIPDKEFRNTWFKNLTKYVDNGGYVLISFWETSKEFVDEVPSKGIYKEDLDSGDMFFGWSDNSNLRYYHKYSKLELQELVDSYKSVGLNLIQKHSKKEFRKNKNNYFLFKKEV